jgi:fatty acid amide hydrolase
MIPSSSLILAPTHLHSLPFSLDEKLRCSSGRRGASVYQVWQVLADLIEMRNKWSDDFQRNSIDAIIFPALPLPALPHGVPGGLSSSVSYMFIANLLQWPCGAVPITTVQPGEEHYNFEDIPVNQRDVFARVAQRVMKGSKGLPMSVSVMTPIFQDETCLKVMRDIEDIANFTCEPKAFLEKDCQ